MVVMVEELLVGSCLPANPLILVRQILTSTHTHTHITWKLFEFLPLNDPNSKSPPRVCQLGRSNYAYLAGVIFNSLVVISLRTALPAVDDAADCCCCWLCFANESSLASYLPSVRESARWLAG